MADSSVRVIITGDAAGAIAALEKTKAAADSTASGMSKSFDKATSDVGNVFTRLGNSMANWGIPFSNAVTNMGTKLDEAKSKGQGFQQAMVDAGGIVTAVGAVAFAGVAYESIKMADSFDKVHATLDNAMKNMGGSLQQLNPQVEATDSRMRNLGLTDTQTEQAMTTLVSTTGNARAGIEYMGLAADVAAGTHRGLTQVSQALGMALDGNIARLKRMGIDVGVTSATMSTLQKDTDAVRNAQENLTHVQDEVASGQIKQSQAAYALAQAHQKLDDAQTKLNTDQGAVATAIDKVTQRFHGDAAAAASTFGGQLDVLRAQFEHIGVSIGNALIPALTALGGAIADVISWFEKHQTIAKALAITVGTVLVAAMTAYAISAAQAAAATIAATWPFLAIGAIVAGIAVGWYELITNWNQVTAAVWNSPWLTTVRLQWDALRAAIQVNVAVISALWVALSTVFQAVWSVIGPIVHLMAAVIGGELTAAADLVVGAFTSAWNLVSSVVRTAGGVISSVGSTIQSVFGAVRNAANAVGQVIGSAFNWAAGAISGAAGVIEGVINGIIGAFNSVVGAARAAASAIGSAVSAASPLAGVLGGNLPFGLAEGGIVSSATLAVIGEAGPEAVVPLSNPDRAAEVMSQAGLVQPFSGQGTVVPAAGGGGGDTVYNLSVNAGVWGDAALAGQQIITLIQQAERRQGTRWRQRTSR